MRINSILAGTLALVLVAGLGAYANADEIATSNFNTPFLNLVDLSGFLWDILDDGQISNGSFDAYDGGLQLFIDGTFFQIGASPTGTEDSGREAVLGPVSLSGLDVTRKVFVPTDDSFARFLEILDNPTGSAIAATVFLDTNLGSDSATQLIATSSGDTTFDLSDDWIITDDFDGTGDPTMVHAFSCPSATLEPSILFTNAPGDDDIQYTFNVNVPANGRVIIMHFASQNQDQTIAAASALHIANLQGSTLSGLSSDEKADVVNYDCGFAAVGGELLSIDSTALLLAGAQSTSWMIPVLLSGIGIGLFVVSRKSE